ncbi:MAG: 23S rRNA (adenine(2503)-C(2))-methyltransferase RlmN, partial [Gammaproteobacteria bacterium]|nr:23S rRNA (adenine(2503)-C(2))-methyltransferase RlmN [Gammaproteobacteria bacterium]
LLDACWDYAEATNAVGITFEYVMLAGVNDSEARARQLVPLLANRPAKVNLIPFNPFPGSHYRRSPDEALQRFQRILQDAGI